MQRVFLAVTTGLVLAGSANGQAIPAHDSARVETIERLFAITGSERLADSVQEVFLTEMRKATPTLAEHEPILREFIAKHGSAAAMREDLIRLYRESFSETELLALLRFYETDVGRGISRKLPAIMNRSTQLSIARIQAHLPELMAILLGTATVPKPN